jgi:hypothetical protein
MDARRRKPPATAKKAAKPAPTPQDEPEASPAPADPHTSAPSAHGMLTTKQQRAIEALLTHPTITEAAAAAGVARQAIHEWMKGSPVFRTAYRQARSEAMQHAISMTQRYAPLAVQTLAKIAATEAAPYAVRVQASAHLLSFGKQVGEAESAAVQAEERSMEYTRMTATAEGVEVERVVLLAAQFGRLKELPPALQEYAKELLEQQKGRT